MKTILVLAGGGATDDAVFATALAIAKPLGAHLEFLHIRVSASEAALYAPHLEYAMGAGLHDALGRLHATAEQRSRAARLDVELFCERHAIAISDDAPRATAAVSASWREERDDAAERMIYHARRHDLVVLGRLSRANGLPPDLAERLLLGGGRPLLLAPRVVGSAAFGTAIVCWKETAASARALGAGTSILARCRRVVVVGVDDGGGGSSEGVQDVARTLGWHGIAAEARWLPPDGRATADQLEGAAGECGADIMVMGGYGRSAAREMIFGGCTQRFLERAERPVLLMH